MKFAEHQERALEKETMHSFACQSLVHFHARVKVNVGAELS